MTRYPLFRSLLLAGALMASASASVPGDSLLGNGGDELLPAEEAFALSVERQADDTWVFHWRIAEDYYLYRERLNFELLDGGSAELRVDEARYSAAQPKDDPFFGEVQVYYDKASVRIPIEGIPDPDARVRVGFQGCNEPVGVCYPPATTVVDVAAIGASGSLPDPPSGASGAVSVQDRIAGALGDQSLIWIALLFTGFGALLAFTPCVFPMIPILAGVIAGDRHATGTGRAAFLSVLFVAAMAVTYAVVGVAIGLTGASFQAWLQQPAVLYAFAGLFVLLALAMFGLFDLQMPGGLRDRLDAMARRLPGGTAGGALSLGVLSALIVGPCVTPPLIGALIYIAETGDPVKGGVALFAMGTGMGIPLIAAGASAGHLLPRAGQWMHVVRGVFGVLLLAVAVWMLQRVLPVQISMILWAVLLIVTGVYMGALNAVPAGWPRLWKGAGLVLMVYGIVLMVGAAAGGQSLLQPLRGILPQGGEVATAPEFREVRGVDGLEAALAEARRDGRPVMVDVSAEWCVACKELEAFTFPDPAVREALGDTLLLRVDVTDNGDREREFLERFSVFGPPAILFFGPDGVERRGYRVVGFVGADRFAEQVRRALPEAAS